MKYISPLISDARNKLGGTVYSRNAHGTYQRPMKAPVQPRTVSQQANRAAFAATTSAWRTLPPATMLAWRTYAATTTLTDSLGHVYVPSGFQCFVSCQQNLLAAGLPATTAPPAAPWSPPLPPEPSLTLQYTDSGLEAAHIHCNSFDYWDSLSLVLSATPPQSPGVNFFASFLYRNMPVSPAPGIPDLHFEGTYEAMFHLPSAGQLTAVRVRAVDPASGLAALIYDGVGAWINVG